MEKNNLNKNTIVIIVGVLALVVLAVFVRKNNINNVENVVPTLEDGVQEEVVENNPEQPATPKETTGAVGNNKEYQDLVNQGHEAYKKSDYATALQYFNQALAIEANDRIYMSLYTTNLALKNYADAERAIKLSLALNKGIPSIWVEYASFENLYMKASFEVVSKVYLDGLNATGNNIDLLTNYSSYLTSMKKYQDAIAYLEQAKIKDLKRNDLFQLEIDRLQGLME